MRYRFQIVASAYHKGRLRIVYDPGYIATLEANVAYTRIVDLVDERDFTIDVAWGNEYAWLETSPLSVTSRFLVGSAFTSAQRANHNGTLGVYVLNDLTAPNDSVNNDIAINVFVSMCQDAEFAAPSSLPIEYTTYMPFVDEGLLAVEDAQLEPQSDPYESSDPAEANAPVMEMTKECINQCNVVDNMSVVHYGESISSFRQLLKRYNYHSSFLPPAATFLSWLLRLNDFPLFRGYTPTGIHVVGPSPVNLTRTTLLNYLAPAFVGVRGGHRVKYVFNTASITTQPTTMIVARSDNEYIPFATTTFPFSGGTLTSLQINRNALFPMGHSGMELTHVSRQPCIEVELPYYNTQRFSCAKDPGMSTAQETSMARFNHTISVGNVVTAPSILDRYISVGEDFQLYLFQGAPRISVLAN